MMRQVINFSKADLPNTYGRLHGLKAPLLCLNHAGVYVEPKKPIVEQNVAKVSEWAQQYNYPKTHCSKYENMAMTGATLATYLTPTLEQPKVVAFGKLCAWLLTMDDIMDNICINEHRAQQNTYDNIRKDQQLYVDILDGKRDANGVSDPITTLIHYKVLANAVHSVYQALNEASPIYQMEKQYFVASIRDFLNGFLWRYRRSDPRVSLDTYNHFRRHHSASFAIFEIVALLFGIKWSELGSIREDVEFQNWRNAYASSIAISNDVLSLRKEMVDNETENLAIQKHLVIGTPIQKAFGDSIRYTNFAVNETSVYGKRLLDRYGQNPQFKKLVEVLHLSVDGHLWWYGYTNRYGQVNREVRDIGEAEYNEILVHKHFN